MSALLFRDITAELKAFLVNEIGSLFCVPLTLAEKSEAALTAAGFRHRRFPVSLHNFVVESLCVTFRDDEGKSRLDEAVKCIFGTSRELVMPLPCIGERQFHPLLVPVDADVTVYEALDKPKDAAGKLLEKAAIAEYRKLLETLSRISGRRVYFHTETSGMRQTFWHDPEAIHVITNSCPPGQSLVRYAQSVYGRLIHPKGHEVFAWGPTAGRGTVLKDDDGTPTVQLLGGSWFLLLPTLSTFNPQTSLAIFERLLGQAWSAYTAAAPPSPEEATSEQFGTLCTSWIDGLPKQFDTDIKNTEERIARLQEDLASAHRLLKESRRFRALLADPAVNRDMRKRAKEDWAAVKALPLVRRMSFVDDGLHVETVPIHISGQDGNVYDLGTFTIRVATKGQVSVWSDAPKQYKGYPHPHINDVGHPCFGNAGTAITQAAGEMRIADAVRYMLRWLSEGYTPALTEIKLETWPRVGESEEAYTKRMGFHQIDDPTLKLRRPDDVDDAVWRAAVEMVGTLVKDPKLEAILADPPGFTEAPESPQTAEAEQQEKKEEKNDAPAQS